MRPSPSPISSRAFPRSTFRPITSCAAFRGPRILKSHDCFQPQYPRVIYIVRDPRDVAVSFYHHNLKAGNIPDGYPVEDFIPRIIAAEFDQKWGTWSDNGLSWLVLRQARPTFLLLRYESMKASPIQELMRVSTFLEGCAFPKIDNRREKLQRAVDLSSSERMRTLEQAQGANWVLTKNTRHDKPFVRTAAAGGWKSTLSPESVERIESAWGPLIESLGYELASPQVASATTPGSVSARVRDALAVAATSCGARGTSS